MFPHSNHHYCHFCHIFRRWAVVISHEVSESGKGIKVSLFSFLFWTTQAAARILFIIESKMVFSCHSSIISFLFHSIRFLSLSFAFSLSLSHSHTQAHMYTLSILMHPTFSSFLLRYRRLKVKCLFQFHVFSGGLCKKKQFACANPRGKGVRKKQQRDLNVNTLTVHPTEWIPCISGPRGEKLRTDPVEKRQGTQQEQRWEEITHCPHGGKRSGYIMT